MGSSRDTTPADQRLRSRLVEGRPTLPRPGPSKPALLKARAPAVATAPCGEPYRKAHAFRTHSVTGSNRRQAETGRCLLRGPARQKQPDGRKQSLRNSFEYSSDSRPKTPRRALGSAGPKRRFDVLRFALGRDEHPGEAGRHFSVFALEIASEFAAVPMRRSTETRPAAPGGSRGRDADRERDALAG